MKTFLHDGETGGYEMKTVEVTTQEEKMQEAEIKMMV